MQLSQSKQANLTSDASKPDNCPFWPLELLRLFSHECCVFIEMCIQYRHVETNIHHIKPKVALEKGLGIKGPVSRSESTQKHLISYSK